MTNQTETVEVIKSKRQRRTPVKVQKTAQDIISEIETLTKEVDELHEALIGLSADNVAHAIVTKAYEDKREAYVAALATVYTA